MASAFWLSAAGQMGRKEVVFQGTRRTRGHRVSPTWVGPALRGARFARTPPLRTNPGGEELAQHMQTVRINPRSVKDVAGLKCKGCSACTPSPPPQRSHDVLGRG